MSEFKDKNEVGSGRTVMISGGAHVDLPKRKLSRRDRRAEERRRGPDFIGDTSAGSGGFVRDILRDPPATPVVIDSVEDLVNIGRAHYGNAIGVAKPLPRVKPMKKRAWARRK